MKRLLPGILVGSGTALALVAVPALAANGEIPPLTQRLWTLTGTFHPMIVHFPIALLTLAAIVEGLRLTSKRFRNISPDVTYYCLMIGAAGAVGAALFGWSRGAAPAWSNDENVDIHRWLGVTVTVIAVLVAGIATLARHRPAGHILHKLQVAGVFAAAGLVGLVGHLGGELTYGEGYVDNAIAKALWPEPSIQPLKPVDIAVDQRPVQPPAQPLPQVTPPLAVGTGNTPTLPLPAPDLGTNVPPTPGALGGGQPVDFITQVQPIFKSHCLDCHGEKKAKAKLRLDTKEAAIAWKNKEGKPLWVAHKSAESFILTITGPNSDEDDRMPPVETEKVLSTEEYETLRQWIDEGAVWPVLPGA